MAEASQAGENAVLGRVDFTCQWCGGQFTYHPNLIGPDLGVRITVDRLGGRCVRHRARLASTLSTQETDHA